MFPVWGSCGVNVRGRRQVMKKGGDAETGVRSGIGGASRRMRPAPPPTLKIHRGPNTALNSRRLAGLRARAMLGGVRTKARFFRRSVEAGSASATAAAGKGNSIAYNDRAWIFVPKIKSILSKLTPLVHLAADLPTARMHDQCPRPIL